MVELLAPAGDKECFQAALMAGADAIYVGGKRYGARAYAGNFAQEDLTECLRLAHLHGKKVYLTVNTLMKEAELAGLVAFLRPFYEEGLDGVIVQDLGALLRIAEMFPGLELHASTQMTVTGPYGAELLKKYGVSRVVPARELSLEEIVAIKEKTGLEIETFVHGAMCYGYSGQCLFSSMLGERSGNRGRCAGPCRLPYTVKYDGKRLNHDNEMYQLSLKDLCTLEVLPHLMDAGIDSFKIEGRMKTPEYVSFVTSMYRKYIDLYRKDPEQYHVKEEDMNLLRRRFSRGSIQPGYYFKQNGRELVTLDKPGYQSFAVEEAVAGEIIKVKEDTKLKIDLIGHFSATVDEPMCFTVYKKDAPETMVVALGDIVSKAQKCAATSDEVRKQLVKTGNTPFAFDEITFEMSEELFLSKKALNELRRDALEQLTEVLLTEYRRIMPDEETKDIVVKVPVKSDVSGKPQEGLPMLHVEVRTFDQLNALKGYENIYRIYISTDMFTAASDANAALEKLLAVRRKCTDCGVEFFIGFPHVCRQKTIKIIDKYRVNIKELQPDGFCVGNLESLAYIRVNFPEKCVVSDAGLYVLNSKTTEFLSDLDVTEHILSYELHKQEISALLNGCNYSRHKFILPVYGYIPVMESAGCLLKTNGVCRHGKGREDAVLVDRHKKNRIVLTHCDRCENTIYNSVPLSLHKETPQICSMNLAGVILKFTKENASLTERILDAWKDCSFEVPESYVREFTKGHFLKSVE